MSQPAQYWEKTLDDGTGFLISSARDLLDAPFINDVLASEEIHWAERMKSQDLEFMLDNSLTFGLYNKAAVDFNNAPPNASSWKGKSLKQIGLARLITDRTTFAYLTDVYIDKQYRSLGLGRWLMAAVEETVDAMPNLRRVMLLTSGGAGPDAEGNVKTKIRFYEDVLGCTVFQASKGLVCMGRGRKQVLY
ncbi:MAG: hypothetical protein M1821_003987 [Bathelium mastoideum]|nr:MAG: hypothetical protein M1821_003987 [Bathelium mastoideum]KAI9691059.1 MAG: hypothetical protein M1822_008679 [Bathelium mastoideum]